MVVGPSVVVHFNPASHEKPSLSRRPRPDGFSFAVRRENEEKGVVAFDCREMRRAFFLYQKEMVAHHSFLGRPSEEEDLKMEKKKSRFAGWRWMLLPVVVLTLAVPNGRIAAAVPAGIFPAFIPTPAVMASGVAVDKVGNVYVSIREVVGGVMYGKIWKYTPAGEPSLFAEIGAGEIYGLAVSADGELYAAMGRVGSSRGVYRVDREGQVELLPGSDEIVFANAIAFDDRGTMYITESYSGTPSAYGQGGIWRIPPGGQAELWLRDGSLTGIPVVGYPIGANGIAFYHGYLYVTNCAPGLVLRIRVWPDGSAGEPEVWATLQEVPESPLAWSPLPLMADDVRLDLNGNVYVAVVSRSAVVRINALDKSQETIAAYVLPPSGSPLYAPLDFSASLAFGTGKGERMNLFVTNLGLGAINIPQLPWPGPGLVKIDAGVPGQPVH
jgi:sugar lactone lactonase YvrE